MNIAEILRGNSYPGRGIVVGTTPNGEYSAVAYFIMGRSVNSRNRVFELTGDGIRTKAYDESKMTDPSLIIYHPVRETISGLVVTNGDQTDTIREFVERGESFEDALRTREYEPDAPNYTPRISAFIHPDGEYLLSILKKGSGGCVRQTFEYPVSAGEGHFIHTYACDGDPIPSFSGEPETVNILDDMEKFGDLIWGSLNSDNKVSLYVRYTSLSTGLHQEKIYNRNGETI